MGKTAGKIFSGFLFIVLFILLLLRVSVIFEHKGGDGDQSISLRSFYEMEENSIDVLCIGSSHAFTSFLPNVFWEEYGVTAYDLGGPSQTIPCSYYLLKEALKYQKPKVVLLEGHIFRTDDFFHSEERLHGNMDGVRLGKVKTEYINTALYNYNWKDRLPYFFPFLLYHSRWDELENKDFNRSSWNKGCNISAECTPAKEPGWDEVEEIPIPEGVYAWFEKICILCAQNQIAIAVFISPTHEGNGDRDREWYLEHQGLMLSLERCLSSTNIPLYYCQKDGELEIDYSTGFLDQQHPNVFLAEEITRNIGGHLVSEFGLTDHFGDPAYESWNRDSETYHALADQLIKEAGQK